MKVTLSLLLALMLVLPGFASASSLIPENFVRTGQQESLTAPFTVFGGSTTTGQWSGLIEVTVSGSGVNVPADYFHEDAFYPFDPADPSMPAQGPGILPPNSLHLSFTGCSASAECGALRITNFFTFVDGIGPVTPPVVTIAAFLEVIPYSPEHTYHFVIDVGTNLSLLTLGHGDGGVFDNSGQYDIQLFSVSAHPVPEPSTLLLVASGFAAMIGFALPRPRL